MKYIKMVDTYFYEMGDNTDCSFIISVEDKDFEKAVEVLNKANTDWFDSEQESDLRVEYTSCDNYELSMLEEAGIKYEILKISAEVEW